MSALGRLLARIWVWLRLVLGVGASARRVRAERERERAERERERAAADDPREREVVATRRRENVVLALLAASAACAVAFIVMLLVGNPIQLEGLLLGGACAFLGAALAVAGNGLVAQVIEAEPLPTLERRGEQREFERELPRGFEGISRRKLLAAAGLGASGTLAAAVAIPAISLGPAVGDAPSTTPWRRGRRLVDVRGRPIRADTIDDKAMLTAFPEGADPRELGSPVAIVRVDPRTLDLPAGRESWAPQGLMAYSKICTHAGCAIVLYRVPKYEPTAEVEPALQCPCHYSTFAVRRGADPIFGPAARALPQLPLSIDGEGNLVAAGELSGPVGPSWWGVRKQ